MQDPTGDLPWDEDEGAGDVEHLADPAAFKQFLKGDKAKKAIVMFYAPWLLKNCKVIRICDLENIYSCYRCGFCKRMKPDYQEAATEVKTSSLGTLAAIDVTKTGNNAVSRKYNITGFPTLLYFENGKMSYPYPGGD